MSDVITKLRINESFKTGTVVFLGGTRGSGIQSLSSSTHDYSTQINSGVISAKYTNRFDDPNYYSA